MAVNDGFLNLLISTNRRPYRCGGSLRSDTAHDDRHEFGKYFQPLQRHPGGGDATENQEDHRLHHPGGLYQFQSIDFQLLPPVAHSLFNIRRFASSLKRKNAVG